MEGTLEMRCASWYHPQNAQESPIGLSQLISEIVFFDFSIDFNEILLIWVAIALLTGSYGSSIWLYEVGFIIKIIS